MTRRERLTAIVAGQIPDRPAVKIWGIHSKETPCVHPAFEAVRDLAVDRTDLMRHVQPPMRIPCGARSAEFIETRDEPSGSPDWIEHVTVYHTPAGDLRQVDYKSTHGRPGYRRENPLKEPRDVRKLLTIPYEPDPLSPEPYRKAVEETADAGIVMFSLLGDTMYFLYDLIGSENVALWSVEAEEMLLELAQAFSERLLDVARAALAAGIRATYAWVGPEVCTPPLMSPAAFEKYVFEFDKPLIDLIHNGGGHIWVHCHGKMRPVLRRFVDMGVDVLNPIEPPPMGDVTMAEAFDMVGDRMALEGGLETHDFLTGSPESLRQKIREVLEAGRGRRMILGPSSGYMDNCEPTEREIRNWLLYVNEAVDCADAMAGAPPAG